MIERCIWMFSGFSGTIRFMLRSRKFRPFEKVILFAIAFLLIGASVACAFLAFRDGQWRLGFASGGGLILAIVYFCAARRGKPL
jgi:hypothetical protein